MHSHFRDSRLADPLGIHGHHNEGLVLVRLPIARICQEASPVCLGGWSEIMSCFYFYD